ncbi:MAG: cytochrome c [Bacteroidetes bacterium]|nr:cytochrome c [Bacteroidota bacterium]MBS1539624.1 cytochrome c [Bacteroidota bacterium]
MKIVLASLVFLFLMYSAFIYQQPVKEETMPEVVRGKMIWQEKNCTACHQLYGLGGFLGPDLTNVYSQEGKGAPYIKAFVQGGTATMPAFNLSEDELNCLVAFLKHTDESGSADPRKFKIRHDGTIAGN